MNPNLKTILLVTAGALIAMSAHQLIVAPMIVKIAKPKAVVAK